METPSNPKTEDYTYKQGQYSPRKRKDTTPKVNPQLAVWKIQCKLPPKTKRFCPLVLK